MINNERRNLLVVFPVPTDRIGKYLSYDVKDDKELENIRCYRGFGLTCKNFGFDSLMLNDLNKTKNIDWDDKYDVYYSYAVPNTFIKNEEQILSIKLTGIALINNDMDTNEAVEFKLDGIILMSILPDYGMDNDEVIKLRNRLEECSLSHDTKFLAYNFNSITEKLERMI